MFAAKEQEHFTRNILGKSFSFEKKKENMKILKFKITL